MDYVGCNGTESRIDECDFPGFGISSCSHYQDAGVVCASMCVCLCVCLSVNSYQAATRSKGINSEDHLHNTLYQEFIIYIYISLYIMNS